MLLLAGKAVVTKPLAGRQPPSCRSKNAEVASSGQPTQPLAELHLPQTLLGSKTIKSQATAWLP